MFQASLKVHDIDADSDMGTSIITDDRSSCRFSDTEEVSFCVCMYMCIHQYEAYLVHKKCRIQIMYVYYNAGFLMMKRSVCMCMYIIVLNCESMQLCKSR